MRKFSGGGGGEDFGAEIVGPIRRSAGENPNSPEFSTLSEFSRILHFCSQTLGCYFFWASACIQFWLFSLYKAYRYSMWR